MENYYVNKNKIVITNLNDFNIAHILECGQVFRYKNFFDHYEVFSTNKKAKIFTFDDKVEIVTNNVDYFIEYFDLNTNYAQIKQKLCNFDFMAPIIEKTYGIRILNQDPFEMIISFIISANNNIKRIQNTIEKLCEKAGEYNEKEDFYAFPTLESLLKLNISELKNLGLGYRAEYLEKTFVQLKDFDYEFIKNNPSNVSAQKLLSLCGVGQKVCDCILLFAFQKSDVFPVDTWIRKVYENYFKISKNNISAEKQINAKTIRENLINFFGNLSGYAQQYLFYYERCFKDKTQ